MREIITGRNAIYEVFHARRRQVFRLLVASGIDERGRVDEIIQAAAAKKIPVERVPRARLDALGEGHQGVAIEAAPYVYSDLPQIIRSAEKKERPMLILVLDMLQNPQNLGTLLRSAEAAGVDGVIIPLRGAAGITPAAVHASVGATEHLLVAQHNLAQALDLLKDAGAWVVGMEGGPASRPIEEAPLTGPLVLVVGNEGEGMRKLIRQKCDMQVSLPMLGQVESLNAAVAGSIALYLTLQARGQAAKA